MTYIDAGIPQPKLKLGNGRRLKLTAQPSEPKAKDRIERGREHSAKLEAEKNARRMQRMRETQSAYAVFSNDDWHYDPFEHMERHG